MRRGMVFCKRYKKGRPRWNLGEREVNSSGGFAPRPPRFNAFVPVRKLSKGKTESIDRLRFRPGPWVGAQVAPQQSPILRPSRRDYSEGRAKEKAAYFVL